MDNAIGTKMTIGNVLKYLFIWVFIVIFGRIFLLLFYTLLGKTVIFLFLIPIGISAYFLFKNARARHQLVALLRKISKAPAFEPSLIDNYVHLTAKVVTPNQFKAFYSNIPCVYAYLQTFAHWSTQRHAPASGWEDNEKPLGEYFAGGEVELDADGVSVFVQLKQEALIDNLLITKIRNEVSSCPEICKEKDQSRYTSYKITEQFCVHGDILTVYGQLKKIDGRLEIHNPDSEEYPMFVDKKDRKTTLNLIWADIEKKFPVTRHIISVCVFVGAAIFFYYLMTQTTVLDDIEFD